MQTPVQLVAYDRLRALWQTADAAGLSAAFTFDHLVPLAPGARPGALGDPPPGTQFDGWMTAQALAVDTTRLRVGTLVTSITHRPIGVLAKMVTTLHAISGGRAVLGVGSGWHQAEHEMFGLTLPSVRDRMELLDESLVAIRALFVADTPVTFEGRCVTLRNATLDPRPTAHTPLPILVGGSGIRLRTIAARHADIYNGFWTPDAWQEVNLDLDERVATFGRNPADLRRSAFVPAELSSAPTRQRQFLELQASSRGGSHDDVLGRCIVAGRGPLEVLRRFHEAGVDQVILSVEPTTDPDDLARFAEEIVTEIERW